MTVNPIQYGKAKRHHRSSFSSVTSTNKRVSPKDFLPYRFDLFATLVSNVKAIPSASSKLLNLNQEHASKKLVSLAKSL